MQYTSDPQFLAMIFILPTLFGFSLIGEGVCKTMNYDSQGWIGIAIGSLFLFIIIIGFFLMNSSFFG